jgi:hypothetical protein
MSWNDAAAQNATAILGLGNPPNDMTAVVSDDYWYWAWQLWAGAQAADGDDIPFNAGSFLRAIAMGGDLGVIAPTYIGNDATNPVELPMGLVIQLNQVTEDRFEGDLDQLKSQIWQNVDLIAFRYLGQFHQDLATVKAELGAQEEYDTSQQAVTDSGITRDHISLDHVDQINEGEQKNLEEGASIDFIQSGNIVLLGDNHYELYYDVIKTQDDFAQGTLTMVEKGGGLSPGEISVTGAGNQNDFKEAIRRYSKKKIEFQ